MEELGQAVQSQLNLIGSRGYNCTHILVDPQRSLVALDGKFPGVQIDATGAGDDLHKVDAKIRRAKEMCRSVKSGLLYKLPATAYGFLLQPTDGYSIKFASD